MTHLNDGVCVDVGQHWGLFSDIGVTWAIDLNSAAVPRVNSANKRLVVLGGEWIR